MPKFLKTKYFAKRHYKLVLVSLALFAVLVFLSLGESAQKPRENHSLNQEEMVKLIKPSVVRIIQHSKGTAVLPNIFINLDTKTISLYQGEPKTQKNIDEYISGTGFIINPDGYILTNAHVASAESVKNLYLEDIVKTSFFDHIASMSDEELKKSFSSEQELNGFINKINDFVKNNSEFNLTNELVVLNPTGGQESLQGLLGGGFKAERVSVNDNYAKDEKDVALLKIDAHNLPSLKLGDSGKAAAGNKIYIFGFPVTAEFNQRSPLESTFTSGIISAIKFSQNKDFSVFQTDAKISQGSSGGPLLNEKGEVVGIITFETGEYQRQAGDNFAFAIPLNLAEAVLEKNSVKAVEGEYSVHVKNALRFLDSNNCKQANAEFIAASKTDSNFGADKYLNSYIQQCEDLIAKGGSIDSRFEKYAEKFRSISSFAWFVIMGRIVLVILAIFIIWEILRRLKKDEQEISELSFKLEEETSYKEQLLEQLNSRGIQLPLPDGELHSQARLALNVAHPHVTDYIKEAREVGLSEEMIRDELARAGWSAEEINQALRN